MLNYKRVDCMNKYKTLALNTVIFAVGSFSSKLLLFLLTRLYTASLYSEDLATKSLLEITANFLIPIFSFSIAEALLRFGLAKENSVKSVFSNAVVIELFGAALLLIVSPLIGLLPYTNGYLPLLIIYIMTSCFRQLCAQFTRVRGLLKLYSLDGIITTLTLFILNLVFIAGLNLGVRGFMLSVICSDLLSGIFLCAAASVPRYFSFRKTDKELIRAMFLFSVALIPTAVLWIFTGFSDRFFINQMISETAAGVYEASSKIPNLISMVSTVFFQAWNISAIVENDAKDREKFYTRVFGAYQSILVIAAGALIALVQPLSLALISTDKDIAYATAYRYTPLLVVAVLLMCFNQFLSSVYTATKHTKNSFWTSLIAAGVNLILNFALIPKFGTQGAVVATLLSYLACYVVRIIDARRFVPFRVNHFKSLVNLLILVGMSLCIIFLFPFYPVYLVCGFVFLCAYNYEAILQTLKKILKRS